MKQILFILCLMAAAGPALSQSQTTLALEKKYEGSLTLFFYKNTLRMLNQQESPEFDQMIDNIEKMKFLMVDKGKTNFGKNEYSKLVGAYQKEAFEAIVTSRIDGRNMDVYLRDAKGSKPGTVVLVNDSSSLFVLDIVGTIDVTKAGALFNTIDGSTDIGKRIKDFTEHKNDTARSRRKRTKTD